MGKAVVELVAGEIVEEEIELTLADLCRTSRLPAETIIEFVELGIIEPAGRSPRQWRFRGGCLQRIRSVQRLGRDLGIGPPGAALVLDLVDEIEALRARLRRLERN